MFALALAVVVVAALAAVSVVVVVLGAVLAGSTLAPTGGAGPVLLTATAVCYAPPIGRIRITTSVRSPAVAFSSVRSGWYPGAATSTT